MDDDNDGGMRWFAEAGQQEYQEWLDDPIAQAEYQQYLDSIERTQHEMD